MQPVVTHFCIFGSYAWAHIPTDKRKALEPQRKECIFVSYQDVVKHYRLLDLSIHKKFIERRIYFDENPMQASQVQHAITYVLPPLTNIEDNRDTIIWLSIHLNLNLMNMNMHVQVQISIWIQLIIQYLLWEVQKTWSLVDIYGAPHAFSATNSIIPMHSYLIHASNPPNYVESIRNP